MGPPALRRLPIALCALTALSAADFTTYIGDANDYHVTRVIADAAGNTYVAGSRAPDLFVMKLDPAGNPVLFAALNGKGIDQPNDLAVDAAGNIYVAGYTSSPLLPVRNALQSTPGPGFLIKFNPDATQILICSYFPAPVTALAIDGAGNWYVTGSTYSPTFPVTPGLPAGTVTGPTTPTAASGAFLTKIAASGDRIVYSTLIVGHQKNCGAGSSCFLSARITAGAAVAVDPSGNAYLAGNTDTADLPVTSGAMRTTGTGAFVAKVNASGSALVYLTYLGPGSRPLVPFTNPLNAAAGIAADAAGNAYVTGSTSDPEFPLTRGAIAGDTDAFIAKLNPQGTGVVWASVIGGKAADAGNAISLDPSGAVWINGTTASADFPNPQAWSQGSDFVAALDPTGATLRYSSRLPNDTAAASFTIDASGTLHFAGASGLISTLSPSLPIAPRIFAIANAAHGSATGRLAPGEVFSIYGPHIGPAAAATAIPDASGFLPTSLGGMQVTINGSLIHLLYVSDSQINAVAPQYLTGPARIRVNNVEFAASVLLADPQIFQTGDGVAIAINQDGSLNSPDRPAPAGSVIAIWATGVGAFPQLQDGKIATAAQDFGLLPVVRANAAQRALQWRGARSRRGRRPGEFPGTAIAVQRNLKRLDLRRRPHFQCRVHLRFDPPGAVGSSRAHQDPDGVRVARISGLSGGRESGSVACRQVGELRALHHRRRARGPRPDQAFRTGAELFPAGFRQPADGGASGAPDRIPQ